jgi:serine/threonine protein kinase
MLGKTLRGRYEIIRELGKGAFGATYLAKDKDLSGNPHCVVKRLKPQLSDPFVLQTAIHLFEREAQVLYKLGNHDQIPRLLAHFQEDREFYLIQEFIDGHDLSKELTPSKQWQQEQVIDFLQDVLKVLEFVHQQDVIHRDLKPANLIRRASDGKIVLINFGAVREISALGTQIQVSTIVSTPGYMPIEQVSGDPKFNSDVYALGVICIQAVTGILFNILPRHPDTNEIIWCDFGTVKPPLVTILDKMVHSDCRQRYQSASEVLHALSTLTHAKEQTSKKPIIQPYFLIIIILFLGVLALKTVGKFFSL